jgi:hypothetical protein
LDGDGDGCAKVNVVVNGSANLTVFFSVEVSLFAAMPKETPAGRAAGVLAAAGGNPKETASTH